LQILPAEAVLVQFHCLRVQNAT